MHNLPINQVKLDELIKQSRHLNVFPIDLLMHYRGREESGVITPLLMDLVEESSGYLSAMSEDEIRSLLLALPMGVRILVGYDTDIDGTLSRERAALAYVVAKVQESYFSIKQVLSGDIGRGAVLQTYPEIRDKLDDDGLLILDDAFQLLPSGITYNVLDPKNWTVN